MALIDEKLTAVFRAWERRGRGWQAFPEPVAPEPPFRPFHYLPVTPSVDDGHRPTVISSFIQRLARRISGPSPPEIPPDEEEEPEPQLMIRDSLVELQTSLPAKLDISREAFEQFLLNLSLCREPIAFELLGLPGRVSVQFAAYADDAPLVRRQLHSHFPETVFQMREGILEQAWTDCEGDEALVVEFGLAREFMLPLSSGKLDPFVGIIGALSELQPGELGLFQVIFQPTSDSWGESIVRSVTHADGSPFFVNFPELVGAARKKVERPLFAAVVRIAVKSDTYERTVQIARDVAGSLRVFAHPQGNELIPLDNSEYPFEEHIEDMLSRQSRRSGMLLNSDELIGFVHLPTSAVRSPAFERETGKTKAAPQIVRGKGLLLGHNLHNGESIPVSLTPEHRVRHTHIIGALGTGKSTLLFNLIRQDIENGEGVAVLDPHGDLTDQILGIIPPNRLNDVVLVDPSDEQYSVGFNILSAHSDLEKNLLASDLVSVFQRLSTAWGDQMGSVLQNAILAFLESDQGGTLADLRRFLLEPAFRTKFLQTVRDPELVYYWKTGFAQLTGNKSLGPIITRLETFLAPKPIRYMVSQQKNRLDFGQILDSGKIFLAKLPQGQMGAGNAFLLGSLLVSKFQQMAMSRQAQKIASRRDFWLYIDEAQHFFTPSMVEILTGTRKYRLGLTLAHHELRELESHREIASAILSSTNTRVVFRVGDSDARMLEKGFSFFEAYDLQNLETGKAICRVEKADNDFNLSVPFPLLPAPAQAETVRKTVIAASRATYATPRPEIEAELFAKFQPLPVEKAVAPSPPSKSAETKSPPVEKIITVSEKEVMPPIAPKPPVVKSPQAEMPPPLSEILKPELAPVAEIKEQARERSQGRGGPEHQAIQKHIKSEAEKLGFRSTIEKPVLEGHASIDVWLERDGLVIACEISFTNTEDNESSRIIKCLKAGIPRFALICADEKKLRKIAAAISSNAEAELASRVEYFQPNPFIEYLKTLPVEPPKKSEKIRRGYKVKHSQSSGSAEEQRAKEDAAIRAIAEAMRQKKKQ